MSVDFKERGVRVEVCERDHVTLSFVDGDGSVKFVAVLSMGEAFDLGAKLFCASDPSLDPSDVVLPPVFLRRN